MFHSDIFEYIGERLIYDVILGCKMLSELGVVWDFQLQSITWDGQILPMKLLKDLQYMNQVYQFYARMFQPKRTANTTRWVEKILDSIYKTK